MATLYYRKDTNSWRVQFRRKGYISFSLTFWSEAEARKFVDIFEKIYVRSPDRFWQWKENNELEFVRMNEFKAIRWSIFKELKEK